MIEQDLKITFDNLEQKLKKLLPILSLSEKKIEQQILQDETEILGFWEDANKAQKITQKLSLLTQYIKNWEDIISEIFEMSQLIKSLKESEIKTLEVEITKLVADFNKNETKFLLSGEFDHSSSLLSIHVGNGGQDAEEFCAMLLRMYLRFSEQNNFKIKLLSESVSSAGIKSVTLEIIGNYAYGYFKSEHGAHRLIRLSPFNAKNLRQTSFAKVEIIPLISNNSQINLDSKDLKIDVYRSSGSGGQSVNTTDSAVRITYLPLNLVVTCQNERSQLQNKEIALKILSSRLLQLKITQHAEKLEELRGGYVLAEFGSQIRTYTLQPYKLVKDHRTNYEMFDPDKVFDGDIFEFIDSYLRMMCKNT